MGGGVSANNVANWTADNVAKFVESLGDSYVSYSVKIRSEGISGPVLSSLKSESEIVDLLKDLGIEKKLHVKVIAAQFSKIFLVKAPTPTDGLAIMDTSGYDFKEPPFSPGEKVTMSPRDIMKKLFEIQGISLDPSDIRPALTQIEAAIGRGFGDGVTKYDCFINYRVAADADLAEKLALSCQRDGLKPFLDKFCLKNGMKWKDGFLQGLKGSRIFLALISSDALSKVRDYGQDHTYDNVLLEYETALKIAEVTNNKAYICPVLVGKCSNGVLTKFTDFNPKLYPDTLAAVPQDKTTAKTKAKETTVEPLPKATKEKVTRNAVRKARTVEVDNDDENEEPEEEAEEEEKDDEEEEDVQQEVQQEVTCGICDQDIRIHTGEEKTCNWPGHEGDNELISTYYCCETDEECGCYMCEECWNAVQAARGSSDGDEADEEMADVEVQPLGTVSFRNKSYYCEVEKVRVKVVEKDSTEAKVQIFINSRCDLSEGALDNPNNVQLLLGEDDSQVAATFESFLTYAQDDFQVTGVATFSVSEENMESLLSEKVSFRYSEEGYEPVVIFLPGSSYRFDNSPKCTNCDEVMVITAETDNGLIWCKFCDESSNGEYWWCSHCAATDFDVCYCFKCKQSLCLHPVCASDHPMKRLNGAPKCYMSDASCDKCNKISLSQEYRQFYHCEDCKFDLCITCAYEEEKGATED